MHACMYIHKIVTNSKNNNNKKIQKQKNQERKRINSLNARRYCSKFAVNISKNMFFLFY